MGKVWNKIEALATHIEQQFANTGDPIIGTHDSDYNWHNSLWSGSRYRRAHVEIVDNRETHKIYILHCTIFPHFNDPSPIWGFDAVCGPNKITGAFHDFSLSGDPEHPMMKWFTKETNNYGWRKSRELPEWARKIFSSSMVAAGNVQAGSELDDLCKLVIDSLDYYLNNVGNTQQDVADYHMVQNRYCYYQKQNPHVVQSMISMGVDEKTIKKFVQEVLFPEIL
jgi:hypothetical protein